MDEQAGQRRIRGPTERMRDHGREGTGPIEEGSACWWKWILGAVLAARPHYWNFKPDLLPLMVVRGSLVGHFGAATQMTPLTATPSVLLP